MNVYDQNQSRYALRKLILNKEESLKYFTNRYKDRDNLKNKLVEQNINVVEVKNPDLDINNIDEIITRFEDSIGIVSSVKQNVY